MSVVAPLSDGSGSRARIDPVPAGSPRPLWSVMIPTFNCARHLGETLLGVLSQAPDADRMQIEVVDDASTLDDPESVVRLLGGDRVQFFRQSANVGHIRNFATCLQRARGHYVHLLHGDDFVLPGFYAAMQRGFESDSAIGATFCRWMVVDETSLRSSVVQPLESDAGPLSDAAARLAEEQRIVTPSIAVRRTAYERLGGFDNRLLCAEDWEMWVRIAASYPVWYEPAVLAAYRTHPDSNTGRHFRLAGELDYTRQAISMLGGYLPADRAPSIMRTARRAYARTALANARAFAREGDAEAARAHLRTALRLSRSPQIMLQAARLLPRSARS